MRPGWAALLLLLRPDKSGLSVSCTSGLGRAASSAKTQLPGRLWLAQSGLGRAASSAKTVR